MKIWWDFEPTKWSLLGLTDLVKLYCVGNRTCYFIQTKKAVWHKHRKVTEILPKRVNLLSNETI